MPELHLKVSDVTQQTLAKLSQQTGKEVGAVIEKAVEEYRRKLFFEGVDRDFSSLQSDADAWNEELEERRLLSNTLLDDLTADESDLAK